MRLAVLAGRQDLGGGGGAAGGAVDARQGLVTLASDATREHHVARHDRDALGVDGAQVGVLEEADEVRLCGFLLWGREERECG